MSVVRWVIVALAAAFALFAILGSLGIGGGGKAKSGGQLYSCPMHPSVVQDHPGECPICSMTLVLKPEGKPKPATVEEPNSTVPGLAAVDLSPERIQLIGMRTATVRREDIGGELRTVGVI